MMMALAVGLMGGIVLNAVLDLCRDKKDEFVGVRLIGLTVALVSIALGLLVKLAMKGEIQR